MSDAVACGEDAVLIVGAGLAGLFLALKLQRPCVVLSPSALGEDAASAWAQGGVAVALSADDDPALHAEDTIAAGAGLVDPVVARLLAENGPDRIADLLALGVPFDKSPDGSLKASLEAAHSRPRVVRVGGDLAGRAIMEALTAAVASSPRIRTLVGLGARALLQDGEGRARGVLAVAPNGAPVRVTAGSVALATGGVGGLYRVTTNPAGALGHGLALAARAGAMIADPEFVQFHPTAIDVGRDPAPLATEALRGEGAKLVDRDGRSFMGAYDPRGELAPRDVVARAIHAERAAGRGAFLDVRFLGERLPEHFPTVFAACMRAGLDPRAALVPIAPAAHYHMGGIATDLWGASTVEGLCAIGECASTGAHGANRLASNSLLEAVVFAARAAERLDDVWGDGGDAPGAPDLPPELPREARAELRAIMAQHLGVARDAAGVESAAGWIEGAAARHGVANELIVARLIAQAALARRESRGAHWRADFPAASEPARRTFVTLEGAP